MAQGYPIMNGQAILTYANDNPSQAKAKAVDKVRDMIEEAQLNKYLKSIVVHEDVISAILNNGVIIRYGFDRMTGHVKGIAEVEAYE